MRTTVVTGAAGGIGRQIVKTLLANGDRVDFGGGSCGDTGRLILRYDSAHYATLLRYQMRSNHAPETTASNLGFRCVYP